jgi:hypothetical protein
MFRFLTVVREHTCSLTMVKNKKFTLILLHRVSVLHRRQGAYMLPDNGQE